MLKIYKKKKVRIYPVGLTLTLWMKDKKKNIRKHIINKIEQVDVTFLIYPVYSHF